MKRGGYGPLYNMPMRKDHYVEFSWIQENPMILDVNEKICADGLSILRRIRDTREEVSC